MHPIPKKWRILLSRTSVIHFYPVLSISTADYASQLRVTEVSTAEDHFLALMSNGTVMAMGCNRYGQLGNNTSINGQTVSLVVTDEEGSPLSDIKSISAGVNHNLALDHQGRVWAWGNHQKGQLGIGHTDAARQVPVAVPVVLPYHAKITAVSAGAEFSLALDEEGRVWAWGDHEEGQLGIGYANGQIRSSPVQVVTEKGPLERIQSISAGLYHSLALDDDGQIWGWGANWEGALGFTKNHPMTKIAGEILPARRSGADFQLEDPMSTKDFHLLIDHMTEHYVKDVIWNFARPVTDAGDVFMQISAGSMQSQAMKADGSVWAWGFMEDHTNDEGRMVNGERLKSRSGSETAHLNGEMIAAAQGNDFPSRDGSKWSLILSEDEPDVEAYSGPYIPVQMDGVADFGMNELGHFRVGRSRYKTEWVVEKSRLHLEGSFYSEYA